MKFLDLMNNEYLDMNYETFKQYLIEIIKNNILTNNEYKEKSEKMIEDIKKNKNIEEIADYYFFRIEKEGK